MKICDLHSHSTFSDGSLTPTELISLAEKQGLSALALTDHNSGEGLTEFVNAGKNSSVEAIPGCEFSTDYRETELHMVGLFLPESAFLKIKDYVEDMHKEKRKSNKLLIENLNKAGYDITYEDAARMTKAKEFNRASVAQALMEKGIVGSVKEAFRTLLDEEFGYYIPPKRLSAIETIMFIKEIGGVSVLAHPFLNLNYAELEEFLPKAKTAGLDGIETLYSKFSDEETRMAKELAMRFGLKESGGSDFHGTAKPEISLGTGCGNLCIPYEFAERLRK